MTVLATIKASETEWLADQDNIQRLGEWLADRGEITTVTECLRFFEKPWKWADEYRQMIGMDNGTHGECTLCGAITDQKANDVFVCPDCLPF